MEKKYNIPIFVPHKGCPYDCVFCNQRRITGQIKETVPDDVTEIIERHLKTLPKDAAVEAAFFGGSFTGIPIDEQSALMERVSPYIRSGQIEGIRLSTRPDYIDDTILTNLKKYGVTTIELGVQSMNRDVLRAANRGHSAEDVKRAARLIHEYGFDLGVQQMTGLPQDTPERSIETAEQLISLKPVCVRIYPTLTIKDTALEVMYKAGQYVPQTVDEAVKLCKRLVLMYEEAGVKVIRVGLQPTEEINENASVTAGPFHAAFGELVENEIYYDIIASQHPCGDVLIYVNPREVSKVCGNRRRNIIRLKEELGVNAKIRTDSNLKKREVRSVAVKTT